MPKYLYNRNEKYATKKENDAATKLSLKIQFHKQPFIYFNKKIGIMKRIYTELSINHDIPAPSKPW